MTNGNNDDDKTRRDLTRIEDLSEYLHPEDEDVDNQFERLGGPSLDQTLTDVTTSLESEDLAEDIDELPDLPVEDEEENLNYSLDSEQVEAESESGPIESSEISFGDDDTIGETPFDFSNNEEESDSSFFKAESDESLESSSDWQIGSELESSEEAQPEDFQNGHQDDGAYDEKIRHSISPSQEKFEEVRNFAQNFSYGQMQGGGNPPFSLIIRNLKYSEDAEDILIILREFGLVTDQNLEEIKTSMEIGSVLIPQISEFCAIVLAHKIRRFDCDLEVGLSDEVHPSKSGDTNPRGLVKKDSLRQNIVEKYNRDDSDVLIHDIIVSTTSSLEGHTVEKYIGVQTSFAIVDEEELERLKFVQKTARASTILENYDTETSPDLTSQRAFGDYQMSFDLLFTDLCDQLKVKALKENANALLGLNYQLSAMPFEKTIHGKNCYQLTCSATLAVVRKV